MQFRGMNVLFWVPQVGEGTFRVFLLVLPPSLPLMKGVVLVLLYIDMSVFSPTGTTYRVRSDKDKQQRQQREKSNRSKGKEAMAKGGRKDDDGGGANAAVIASAVVLAPFPTAAVLTSSGTSTTNPVTADGGIFTEELQDDMYCTIREGDGTQEEPGRISKESGGLEVEVGDTEREPGVHAPVRRKKRLQLEPTANWTLDATTLVGKGREGRVEYGPSARCETKEVAKGQGVSAECSV